jgi:hypothetical protein
MATRKTRTSEADYKPHWVYVNVGGKMMCTDCKKFTTEAHQLWGEPTVVTVTLCPSCAEARLEKGAAA